MNIVSRVKAAISLVRHGPLIEDGWLRSNIENQSVDQDGSPIPWITYPALDFIKSRIERLDSVFEYGSGNGTLWWAKKSNFVRSIENDPEWHTSIKKIIPDNVDLHFSTLDHGSDYEDTILIDDRRYDIIVIDGRRRNKCMGKAIHRINSNGIIILDNSDRSEYKYGIKTLLDSGFKKIEFKGFCPIVNFKSETAIFYKSENIFGI